MPARRGMRKQTFARGCSLRAGERFDFYRWQQDRDRLQRFYREREFLEARVSARRTLCRSNREWRQSGVALEYEIDRGPETRLTIEGHLDAGDLIERMKDAWVWAVFDGFLLDDLTIAGKGAVDPETDISAQTSRRRLCLNRTQLSKRSRSASIRARATPAADRLFRSAGDSGRRARCRRSRTGHRCIDVARTGRPAGGNRTAVSIARISRSRRQGSGTGLPGQSAELPVQITEGRQYTIAGLDVERRESALDRAGDRRVRRRSRIGVPAGRPRARSPRRRARLPRATATTTCARHRDHYVDENRGQVDLVLDVDEGRQQVLAGVDVKGAAITRRGVIDRALDVELGQPANQAEFFRAENAPVRHRGVSNSRYRPRAVRNQTRAVPSNGYAPR